MASNTHIVQNNQIWLGSFLFGDEPALLCAPNGLVAMAIQAVFVNRRCSLLQLVVAIGTGNFVIHGMLRMIEYHLIFVVHFTGGKRIFKVVGDLGFGVADPANQKQEHQ